MDPIPPLSIWTQLFAAPGAKATARASHLSQASASTQSRKGTAGTGAAAFNFSFSVAAIQTRSQQYAAPRAPAPLL